MEDKTTIRSFVENFLKEVLDVVGDALVHEIDFYESYLVESRSDEVTLFLYDGDESGEPLTLLSVGIGIFNPKVRHQTEGGLVSSGLKTPGFADHTRRQMVTVLKDGVESYLKEVG